MRRFTIVLIGLTASLCSWAQERPFPFPAIPEVLNEPQARLEFLMERYWSMFD
ncbi:MAG: DUF5106 domain-containing protein, partial [Bacteroidaceae bacterium]|nr:DUF5106 domain-containing protein [Bacteroidaceae bacterium]